MSHGDFHQIEFNCFVTGDIALTIRLPNLVFMPKAFQRLAPDREAHPGLEIQSESPTPKGVAATSGRFLRHPSGSMVFLLFIFRRCSLRSTAG